MQSAHFGHRHDLGTAETGGYVLAGGASRRMGTDKALLTAGGITLLEHAVHQVRQVADFVTVVADPARYRHLGFRVIPDLKPHSGPLGGIVTALADTASTWNLIIACDMPALGVPALRALIEAAIDAPPDCRCILPLGPTGPEPLCAVYHRAALPILQDALRRGTLKMRTAIASLAPLSLAGIDHNMFRNINTPEDWAPHE